MFLKFFTVLSGNPDNISLRMKLCTLANGYKRLSIPGKEEYDVGNKQILSVLIHISECVCKLLLG